MAELPEQKADILLVDDRRENLVAIEAILEPLGERLWLASSGREALRHLLEHDFALILMDVQMPGMSGFETAELIRSRERTRHIPIIFVTAHGEAEHLQSLSYSVGAVDYIPKPFNPEILRSKVRVFVELYKKNEQIKRQERLLHEAELRDVERRQDELQKQLERDHMRRLTTELEARVAERTAELVQANEEMEAFCYSVSHDLRAPLRSICSTSMMLLEEASGKLEPNEQEYLERQAAAARRLGDLIDDLLNLSRIGRRSVTRESVSFSDLANESIKAIAERDWPVSMEVEIEPGLVAHADPGLLRILLDNLIENAFKYSPKGGTIRIGREEREGTDFFFVRDPGIGFKMEYAERIFLPFERLVMDSDFEGTGIGLANVQRIVSRHRGKVWAESEPGKGTTFYFSLGSTVN